MTFEPRELCEKDRALLNEVREHFYKQYERFVGEWNTAVRIRRGKSIKQVEIECAHIQGMHEGIKFCADMLLHLLGQTKHEPLTPPAQPSKVASLQDT